MKVLSNEKTDAAIGCLLGTAVGDAIGLPCEGLSKRRLQKIYRHPNKHHFCFGKGMISDDTEHTCMVAQSLIVSAGDERIFARELAGRLKLWLLGLPAGVGFATLRAILKLWLGYSYRRSGVFSAGNGPAMRSAIIGLCYGDNLPKMRSLVKVSIRLTHTDPKAEWEALAVAIAAFLSSQKTLVTPQEYYQKLAEILDAEAAEFLTLIQQAADSAACRETAASFSASIGKSQGVSGYVYHTVSVVIQVWLQHQRDYQRAIGEIISLGGDADTTAAILGGIIGAGVGKEGIPQAWLDNLWEWPRTVEWMEAVAQRLAAVRDREIKQTAVALAVWGILPRNLFFLLVVLWHGCRRLFPPW
ncbi:MAG: ADP-ribosylglycohydrolase family protein [Hormoscilla sp. GM7CHS1pb]|nr:ADP-ribosylglycohydrolase family protein [Hormoscilla sp. GM7CHS1pb]